MREIQFRGFNRKNNVWLYGFYLQNRGAHFVTPDEFATGKTWDDYEIGPDTLGQYTGLKDKNGKEIYEGDIVEWHYLYRVEYHMAHFTLIDSDGYPEKISYPDEMEVIGNIHDNPEFLKTAK